MATAFEVEQEVRDLIGFVETAFQVGKRQSEEIVKEAIERLRAVERLAQEKDDRARLLIRQLLDRVDQVENRAAAAERQAAAALAKRDEALRKEAVIKEHFAILDEERANIETEAVALRIDKRVLEWENTVLRQERQRQHERDWQFVPLDKFCPCCGNPWRHWDGRQYRCWQCG